MTLGEVWERFVVAYGEPASRTAIYWNLEQVVQDLLQANITCDIWLDGSLLTDKPDPGDLDITVVIDSQVIDSLDENQLKLVDKLTMAEYGEGVDSFVLTRWPIGHEYFGTELDEVSSWNEVYGAEHSKKWLKGFVVLRLNETDVGLLIRRR